MTEDSFAAIDTALRVAGAARERTRELDEQLRDLDVKLQRVRGEEAKLQRRAEVAAEELARLDGWFARWFGRSGQQRGELAAQIRAARTEQDALDAESAPLFAEHAQLTRRRAEAAKSAANYASALAAKEAELRSQGGSIADRLAESAASLRELRAIGGAAEASARRARDAEEALVAAREGMPASERFRRDQRSPPLLWGSRQAYADTASGYLVRAQLHLSELVIAAEGNAASLAASEREISSAITNLAHASTVSRTHMDNMHAAITVALSQVRELLLVLERRAKEAGDAVAAAVREHERWIEDAGGPSDE
jgi:hypothetical protein